MNHLPSVEGGPLPEIRVPVLSKTATNSAIYDGDEHRDFPKRRGFRTYLDPNGEDCMLSIRDLSLHSYYSVLAFIQAWLYFGTLHTAFNILGLQLNENSFIRDDADGRILDSSTLLDILKSPSPAPQGIQWLISRRPFFHDFHRYIWQRGKRNLEKAHRLQIHRLCHHIIAQVQDLEISWHHPQHTQGPFAEILLSIRVLAWTFMALSSEVDKLEPHDISDSFGTIRPSSMPLLKHLPISKGWCPHQAVYLCSRLSPASLYYLASVKRTRDADHTACINADGCRASNISQDFAAKHVLPCNDQSCSPVTPKNPERMLEILKVGDLPIVVAIQGDDGLELWYDVAKPYIAYTAASHVWSDGLGDPQHNHLPECQLARLMNRLYEARRCLHYSNARAYGSAAMQPNASQFNKRYDRVMKRPIAFWLDAFCIPAWSTDQEVKRLKTQAIMQMVPVYGMAHQLLIFDSELQRVRKNAPGVEHLAALLVCTWRTRYWTYQELTLAGTSPAIVQFKHPVRLQHLLDTASKGGFPYRRNDSELLNVRYRKDTTSRRTQVECVSREFTSLLQESKVGAIELRMSQGSRDSSFISLPSRLSQRLDWRAPTTRVSEHVFFEKMWCSFLGKTSSLPEDMLGILANMLNLNPEDLLQVHVDQRVHAILASYGDLPVSLLLSCPPVTQPGAQGREPRGADLDRWIPLLPGDRDLPPLADHDAMFMNVCSEGFLCSATVSSNILWVEQLPIEPLRSDGWFVEVETRSGSEHFRDKRYFQVVLIYEDSVGRTLGDARSTLLLLPGIDAPSGNRKRPSCWLRGACFQRQSVDSEHVISHWVCAVKYRECHISCLETQADVAERNCVGKVMAQVAEMKDRRMVVGCGNSPSQWPRIRTKRRPGVLSPRTHPFLRLISIVFALGCLATLLWGAFASSTAAGPAFTPPLMIAAACCFFALLLFTSCRKLYALAQWYIGLATFFGEEELSRPWWRKLHKTLPWWYQRGRDDVPLYVPIFSDCGLWVLHFVVFTVRTLEVIFLIPKTVWKRRSPTARDQDTSLRDLGESPA